MKTILTAALVSLVLTAPAHAQSRSAIYKQNRDIKEDVAELAKDVGRILFILEKFEERVKKEVENFEKNVQEELEKQRKENE